MKLMFSCRQVAELLSRSLDEPLGWVDRMRMRLHVKMCGNCSNVDQQLQSMRTMSGDMFAMDELAPEDTEDLKPRH